MDALRVGRSLRALRIRRGWRQSDAAEAAGLSRPQYARIERGEIRGVPITDIDAACVALGADLDVRVRWHGEGLDRLLDAAHAELVNHLVRDLDERGWVTAVEVSFNDFGDRGSVDIVAGHSQTSTILIVEVKSVVPDVQSMIATHDRKARLAAVIGRGRGWTPAEVGRLLVVGDSATSRGRVREFGDLFRSAYPERAIAVRRWLRAPVGSLSGLLFVRNSSPDVGMKRVTGRQRVRRRGGPGSRRQ